MAGAFPDCRSGQRAWYSPIVEFSLSIYHILAGFAAYTFAEDFAMDFIDDLERLRKLHEAGTINDEEYAAAKAKLLHDRPENRFGESPTPKLPMSPEALERETRQWAVYLHLSQFANFVAPPVGIVAPILIWQLKKAELPGLDEHGKNAVNWIISSIIYTVISVFLAFVIIGIPLLLTLIVVSIIFPVMAATKANNGEVWKYPLTFTFIK